MVMNVYVTRAQSAHPLRHSTVRCALALFACKYAWIRILIPMLEHSALARKREQALGTITMCSIWRSLGSVLLMAMAVLANESDFASILEDVDAEGSLLVYQEEVIELTGATVTTARSVVPSTLLCYKCRGACKTVRCPCKAANVGCHSDRCKCSTSKCSNQMESNAVNADELAKVGSGDEEPEQFCKCAASDPCNTTACYCLAIKKKKCDSAKCTCAVSMHK